MSMRDVLVSVMFGLFLAILASTCFYFFKLYRLSKRLKAECPVAMKEMRQRFIINTSDLLASYKIMIEPAHAGTRSKLSEETSRAIVSTKRLLYVTASLFMLQLFVGLYISLNK